MSCSIPVHNIIVVRIQVSNKNNLEIMSTTMARTLSSELYIFTLQRVVYDEKGLIPFFAYEQEDAIETAHRHLEQLDTSTANVNIVMDYQEAIMAIGSLEMFCPYSLLLTDELFANHMEIITTLTDNYVRYRHMDYFAHVLGALNRTLWREMSNCLDTMDYVDTSERYSLLFSHFIRR